MRIAGLASGMDIDSIVKDLMRAERIPLDKLKQKKQILEWQRDDFRAINTKLLAFRDKLAQLKLTSNYRARTTSSSNDAYVSATATSGASQASYSISKVEQLASAATRVNKDPISITDPTKALANQDLGTNFEWEQGVVLSKTFNVKDGNPPLELEGKPDNDKVSIKVNGQRFEVVDNPPGEGQVSIDENGILQFATPLAKDTVVKVDYVLEEKTVDFNYTGDVENPMEVWNIGATSITEATIKIGNETFKVNEENARDEDGFVELGDIGRVDLATGTITFEPELTKETKIEVSYSQNYSAFEIETHTSKGKVDEQFFITGNDSLNSVIRKVNESDAGVTMFYDSFTNRMTLTRKETGDFNDEGVGLEIKVSEGFIQDVLKFDNSTDNETGGENAKFTINGLSTERNSNTFDMSGVTFTLKQKFTAEDIEPTVISIANDSNQVFENIKEFVNQYNELIAEIGDKLNEERHRSYQPLTDDEREEISEKQQEKWEDMARSGLLKGDPLLSSVLTNMRLDMSSVIGTNGLFNQLASIGISTTSNYLDGGKLQINEAKLKEAIEQDPESVENLFRSDGSTSDLGVIHKLYNTVDASLERLREKAGRATSTNQQFSIGRELLNVDKSIDRFEERMKLTEDRYWRQFTAMEKAIQRANQQSMFLMNQFGGM